MGKGHRDKVAVVTGAAGGIGQAFAKRLAEDGAHVVIADIQPADDTVKMVEQFQRRALAVKCDVGSPDSIAALAKEVDKAFGRCDILVNNAGVYPWHTFDTMTYADWRALMAINLDSVFLASSAFVPSMKQRGWGRIVNMASSTVGTVVPHMVHYIASKGGVIGFTRALATDLGNHGITVNAISPGLTRTPGVVGRGPGVTASKTIDDEMTILSQSQAIKRPEQPDDLVGAMSFLTSDDAAFITGQTIVVDGGKMRL